MRYRFGLFEFEPATGALSREGSPIRLQPQPARVLALLVERAGRTVTRDELRAHVWRADTFVDFERGLNFCIAQVRGALGDVADSPRFIETLPRRGYRFIAPVQPVAVEAAPSAAPPPPRPARALPRSVVLVALGLAALVATAFWVGRPAARPIRIGVVPFDNETGSPAFDEVARGLADATVARLATPERVSLLSVVGNAAVLRQPRERRDLRAIGEALDLDYVVLGQVKSDAGSARLIAHLIRVSDQAHLWARTFDRPLLGLDVQAELAEEIAEAVATRLTSSPAGAQGPSAPAVSGS
jgi:DNA-binding winged helix-turn-helix (wHTH) protein/TolB-like protein